MARVQLENLVKTYPAAGKNAAFTAVKGIHLEIHDGEFMVLVGPSGCGKSTTLRMIAGLEEASAGCIRIADADVTNVLPKDRDIAMVFQNYALYPHMSVYDNMGFGLKLRGVPKPEIDRRVREAAAMLGLDQLLDRKPKALSGGQRQRVAVGRAIVRQPQVFLFDEPLSNLDAKMRVATRAEIVQLHARLGATMIYVTHDQVEAMTMGDRICVMRDGHIMQVAEPLQLYHDPENLFVAGFIGSPPMNFFRGRIESLAGVPFFAEDSAGAQRLNLQLPAPLHEVARRHLGASVVLGIRPEDIHEVTASAQGPSFEARVDLVEPMGAETYLHAEVGGTRIIARVNPAPHHAAGKALALRFDLAKVRLFDAQTENRLR